MMCAASGITEMLLKQLIKTCTAPPSLAHIYSEVGSIESHGIYSSVFPKQDVQPSLVHVYSEVSYI